MTSAIRLLTAVSAVAVLTAGQASACLFPFWGPAWSGYGGYGNGYPAYSYGYGYAPPSWSAGPGWGGGMYSAAYASFDPCCCSSCCDPCGCGAGGCGAGGCAVQRDSSESLKPERDPSFGNGNNGGSNADDRDLPRTDDSNMFDDANGRRRDDYNTDRDRVDDFDSLGTGRSGSGAAGNGASGNSGTGAGSNPGGTFGNGGAGDGLDGGAFGPGFDDSRANPGFFNSEDAGSRSSNRPEVTDPLKDGATGAGDAGDSSEAPMDGFGTGGTDASESTNGNSGTLVIPRQRPAAGRPVTTNQGVMQPVRLSAARPAARSLQARSEKTVRATQVSSSDGKASPVRWISLPLPEGSERL
ncbi:MAG: hypothetical protein KDA85_20970 [Planctomycetaceae bacterium]|nr:hypothetical protein [Planctomycetaceae bacterium]